MALAILRNASKFPRRGSYSRQEKEQNATICTSKQSTTTFEGKLLGGGFKYVFMFTPIIGEDSHFDEHIFQMG